MRLHTGRILAASPFLAHHHWWVRAVRERAVRRTLRTIIGLGSFAAASAAAAGPENLLLIADPANADSLHVANYYIHARQLPDARTS